MLLGYGEGGEIGGKAIARSEPALRCREQRVPDHGGQEVLASRGVVIYVR